MFPSHDRAAHDAASNGDTIELPACSQTIQTEIDISTGVHIRGRGCGRTQLTFDPQAGGTRLFDITATNGQGYQISGLQLIEGSGIAANCSGDCELIRIQGHARDPIFRVNDNCVTGDHTDRFVAHYNSWIYSLIDHNYTESGGGQFVYVDHDLWGGVEDFGDGSWSAADNLGSADRVILESNTVTGDGSQFGLTDGHEGARITARYNVCRGGCTSQSHGTESGGEARGLRSLEIYNNDFDCDSPCSLTECVLYRSGSGVVTANSCDGTYNKLVNMSSYRLFFEFNNWEGADGTKLWDTNDATGVFDSGTHDGGNGAAILTDSGESWTTNEWVDYVLLNTTQGHSSWIQSNTATTITFAGASGFTSTSQPAGDMTFDTGDSWEIRRVTQSIDQPGAGSSDVPTRPLGASEDLSQGIEGIYIWSNTGSVTTIDALVPGIDLSSDYFTSAKSGWTALLYPHASTGLGAGNGGVQFP